MDTATSPRLLHLSTSPHIRQGESVRIIMLWVIGSLLPAAAFSCYVFGWRALAVILVSMGSAVVAEFGITRMLGLADTVGDCSALVTGLLLGMTLPSGIPLWMPALAALFAISFVKIAFGGLGHNFVNPAIAGRAFLMLCYPLAMTHFSAPGHGFIDGINGVSGATPLAAAKGAMAAGTFQSLDFQDALFNLLVGRTGGSIGETSAALLLLGAAVLWYRRIISLLIPAAFVGTVIVLSWLAGGTGDLFSTEALIVPAYQALAGGLILGAFFMATDPVSSPLTPFGRAWFGLGCGILTYLFRKFSGYPEGVTFAILSMNCAVPLLDRVTRPRRFGEVKNRV